MKVFSTLILLWLIPWTFGAFLETLECKKYNHKTYVLDKFLIDVALDTDSQKLKFFMNTKVVNPHNESSREPIITDVNSTTNKYTTLHASIKYMGDTIIDENKRFCDVIGVKNTSQYLSSPRFTNTTASNYTTIVVDPEDPLENGPSLDSLHNNQMVRRREFSNIFDNNGNTLTSTRLVQGNNRDLGFAAYNGTIDSLFDNSTGNHISCPLYVNDSIYMYYEVDVGDRHKGLGSFQARFAVVDNDLENEVLACNRVFVTPAIPDPIRKAVIFGALLLILTTGVINFLTIVNSSYQESQNPFLLTASSICNGKLLRQLDATVQKIILYLQFALFTAGLNLNYPGFYQPGLGLLKWSALLGFSVIKGNDLFLSTDQDNVYVTFNAEGLNSLVYFSTYQNVGTNWGNFIITLVIWIAIQILAQALYLILTNLKELKKNMKVFVYNAAYWRRAGGYVTGIALSNFMIYFSYPFLTLSLFTFYLSSNRDEYQGYGPGIATLRADAFARDISYDSLFGPMSYIQFQDDGESTAGNVEVDQQLAQSNNLNITFPNMTQANYTVVQDNSPYELPKTALAFCVLCFVLWVFTALFFIFRYLISFKKFKIEINKRVTKLYTSVDTLLLWASLYHHYKPSKNYYVIVDILFIFLKLLIISCVQSSGLAQVISLIIIEASGLILLIVVKPFYLDVTWTTTRYILPVAKLLITILCIPFLHELALDETTKTNVSFAQFIIHLIIAFVFLVQLVYCFIRTIISIIKYKHERIKNKNIDNLNTTTSLDEFNRQFEFQPMDQLLKPITDHEDIIRDCDESIKNHQINFDEMKKPHNPDIYYRADAEKQLQNRLNNFGDDSGSVKSDNFSFHQQQEFSNKRKDQNDYTFREADLIYRKYFIDESIDPEIKELWESRGWKSDQSTRPEANTTGMSHTKEQQDNTIKHKIKHLWGKSEEPVERGFHVSRPRPLIVKKPEDVNRNTSTKTSKTMDTSNTFKSFSGTSSTSS